MNMISWNVRELGGKVKKNEVRSWISQEKPDLISLQETKMESINLRLCQRLWGNNDVEWAFKPSEGRSGGLLSVWNRKIFSMTDSSVGDGFLVVRGIWGPDNLPCGIINIYSSCILEEKKLLWEEIGEILSRELDRRWCLMGYFNAVRTIEERRGSGISTSLSEIRYFNEFIENNHLVDLPLLWVENSLTIVAMQEP